MPTTTPKPLHEDIPTDTAWVVGRRIYVRCGKTSQLNEGLIELGARFDWDAHARWTGTGKREAVTALVLSHLERIKKIEAVKALGYWVSVPRGADALHDRARDLGGLYDKPTYRWAMPDQATHAELTAAVQEHHNQQAAAAGQRKREQAEARRQANAEEREYAEVRAEQQRVKIVADSGRATVGDRFCASSISTRHMNRATADSTAWPVGSVQRLRDGRRVLILDRTIWFTNQDDATDIGWHHDAPDEAHWNFQYTVIVVEPTPAEQEADATEAAETADAKALHLLFHDRAMLDTARAVDTFTAVNDANRAGMIEGHAGTGSMFATGTVILTRDERVVWRHPGYYDDWTRTEAIVADPDLVQRVRTLINGGSRRRVHVDQMPYEYVITVLEDARSS